jgi:hypothetical protein
MTKPVEEIENILYDLNIEDKDGDVWIDNRKEIAEAILSWHHQAMKQEIRKVISRFYVDIYRLKGKTINKQAGFIHKHIILKMIEDLSIDGEAK